MCGIMGAVSQRNIVGVLLDGLRHLEYRGYDSAGLAVIDNDGNLQCLRRVGKVKTLTEAVQVHSFYGVTGIAHTRWATHGEATKNNTHPHISGHIAVVHNGIIENHELLRMKLRKYGYKFTTQTDTEVIAHLINYEQHQQGGHLCEIVKRVAIFLSGTYCIVTMDSRDPSLLVAASFGSPLVIGIGASENFLASDQLALLPFTHRFISLEEGDISEITCYTIRLWNKAGKCVKRPEMYSQEKSKVIEKGLYQHYMQKEIFEQPEVIKDTLKNRFVGGRVKLSELNKIADFLLRQVQYVQIIACGTSYHAALVSRYWFEELAGISCNAEIASEFRYRKHIVRSGSLLVALSQSGETADTLAVLRSTKALGYIGSLAICNVASSSLVRESDMALITLAGTEISVASTKAFTTQLTVLLMLVTRIGHLCGMKKKVENSIVHALKALPSRLEKILLLDKPIKILAKRFLNKNHALFLGRRDLYPIAMEGALKLKEISYIHAEAYAAGELKHGPLALISADIPVIVIAPKNELLKKLKSSIEEIRVRKGILYVFTEKDTGFIEDETMKIISLPYVEEITAPISYTIPMQLLAYHIALIKKTDIDQPRNLAKSVTVE